MCEKVTGTQKQQQLLYFRQLNWSFQTCSICFLTKKETLSYSHTTCCTNNQLYDFIVSCIVTFQASLPYSQSRDSNPGLLHFLCKCRFLFHGFRDRPHSLWLGSTLPRTDPMTLAVPPQGKIKEKNIPFFHIRSLKRAP